MGLRAAAHVFSMKLTQFGTSLVVCGAVLLGVRPAVANPGMGANLGLRAQVTKSAPRGQFQVPEILRARVDFWKDVFTKYTSNQVVVHHRDFPQIRFGVLDFSAEAKVMNPVQLERYRDRAEADAVGSIKRQLLALAQGEEPQTPFQRDVVERLAALPGGNEKYKKLVDEDLIRTQSGIRERYGEAIRRSWKYLPAMEQIFVSEFGLPRELTRIPFIESSFDYSAYSSVGAAGIWQFMPRTARSHRLLVGRFVDERRDPLRATRAAAEYLRGAYNSLGAWPLAITSYNHGIAGVRGKVNKAGTNDLAAIIEDPRERYFGFASTNFYPEFLAALEIYDEHETYFPEIPAQAPLRVYTVPVKAAVPAAQISRQLGVPLEALKEANYALLDPVWRGAARIPAGYSLRVPLEFRKAGDPEGAERPLPIVPVSQPLTGSIKHRVQKGESLAEIAKRYHTTLQRLMELNGLSAPKVKPGQQVIVRDVPLRPQAVPPAQVPPAAVPPAALPRAQQRAEGSDVAVAIARAEADEREPAKQKPAPARVYVVKAGDSLSGISKKTGASLGALKRANGLKGPDIVVGQALRLP